MLRQPEGVARGALARAGSAGALILDIFSPPRGEYGRGGSGSETDGCRPAPPERAPIELFELNTELHPDSWNVWDDAREKLAELRQG